MSKYPITKIYLPCLLIIVVLNGDDVLGKIAPLSSHQSTKEIVQQNFAATATVAPDKTATVCTPLTTKKAKRIENFGQIPVSKLMRTGSDKFGDSFKAEPSSFPCWFNPDLARQGQKFAQKNFASILLGHLLSLVMLLANDQARRVMVATKRSDSPEKAFKRYTATVVQVKLWYMEDILDPVWLKSLTTLRQIHEGMGHHLKSLADNNLTDFSKPLITKPNGFRSKRDFLPDEKMWTAFHSDLTHSKLNLTLQPKIQRLKRQPREPYNQYLMMLTQWSFVGMPILFPQNLGIPQWTQEELTGFGHLWALISYVLGADEKFILCKNPLEEGLDNCKNYLNQVYQQYMIPPLFHLDFEGRLMIEALLRSTEPLMGLGQPDYFLIELLEDILQIPAPQLNSQAGWQTRFARFSSNLLARSMANSPILQNLLNLVLGGEIQLASQKNFGHPATHPESVAESTFFLDKR